MRLTRRGFSRSVFKRLLYLWEMNQLWLTIFCSYNNCIRKLVMPPLFSVIETNPLPNPNGIIDIKYAKYLHLTISFIPT